MNLYYSIFQIDDKSYVEIGTGAAFNHVWNKRGDAWGGIHNNGNVPVSFVNSTDFKVGANFIMKYNFYLKNNFIFTLKAYRQFYQLNDNITGVSVTLGKTF